MAVKVAKMQKKWKRRQLIIRLIPIPAMRTLPNVDMEIQSKDGEDAIEMAVSGSDAGLEAEEAKSYTEKQI
jgi:hypothetical protein